MKKLNWVLIVLNAALLVLSNVLILMQLLDRKDFDFGANVLVALCLLVAGYSQLNPEKVSWFGGNLDSGHNTHVTINGIFVIVCLVPALFMNLNPYMKYLR